MNIKHILSKNWLLMGLAVIALVSCSEESTDNFFKRFIKAPAASIERDVKGHEQIYAVHAILRMGYKGGEIGVGPNGTDPVQVYNTYHTLGDSLSLPIMQEIDIEKDDDGQMTVTTERDHFDVIASDNVYYGLELKYYDQNGMLINHQFSGFPYVRDKWGIPIPDEENSTLLVHQHFFAIGNTTLTQANKENTNNQNSGLQLAFPRSLDKNTYYDRFTFASNGGNPEPASKVSSSNIYAPEGFKYGENSVVYNLDLAWKAVEISGKPEALNSITGPDGKTYRLYKTIESGKLNALTPELFTYQYRDTDPVEEELGKLFQEAYNDDFIDEETNSPRQRYGHTVGLLRQERSLEPGKPLDRLGFKGVLQFKQANLAFQLQVKICHILNKGKQQAGGQDKPAKYTNAENVDNGYMWDSYQLQPGWDSFDIDYPLPIRVIADMKDGQEKFTNDVLRYYPNANKTDLVQLFTDPTSFFYPYRRHIVIM